MRILNAAIAVAAVTSIMGASARADTINGTLAFGPNGSFGGQYWSPDSITNPGQFFYVDGANQDTATFSGNTLTLVDQVFGTANGWEQTFFDVTSSFKSLTLISSNFLPGITYGLSGGKVTIDWNGTLIGPETYTAAFNVTTTAPEASTWAMLILGFAGLGFAGYRRARVAVSAV